MLRYLTILLFILFSHAIANEGHNSTGNADNATKHDEGFFHLAEVKDPLTIAAWLIIASLSKIVFAQADTLTKYLPESSLLIVLGVVLGLVLNGVGVDTSMYTLDAHVFFLYLLPPIIFDAGYFMPNRALFENFDSVVLFAIVGTVWNTLSIGASLYGLSLFNIFRYHFTYTEVFVFSALISAVDPVAVIAVFEEIHVNEFLFINVFGEALFNDGVTVVLYRMFASLVEKGEASITWVDYALGGLSFFGIALGGVVIGIVFAFIASFATKFTFNIKTLAPVFIFVVPYMAYLFAEMTSTSSIMAIAFCGMVMKTYIKGNVGQSTAISVKYFTKMLAQSSETVIFMFLGLSAVGNVGDYDLWFILATLVFCLLYRTIGVVVQCAFLNSFRRKKFSKVDQFILSYGGLRGAIAFGLAVSMSKDIQAQPMFASTTIVVIFFTVFLQGSTIRPLVNTLDVEIKENRAPTMAESVYNKYLDFMMSGIEDIAGQQGTYSYMENFERFNSKILRPLLQRNRKKSTFDATSIVRAYAKITLEEALNISKNQQLQHKAVHDLRQETRKDSNMLTIPGDLPNRRKMTMEKFLSSNEHMESLYSLFSNLLDRKMQELEHSGEVTDRDDIKDDYMREIHSNHGSFANLRAEDRSDRRASHGKVFSL